MNPAFVRWMEAKQAGMSYQDPRLGYRPSPAEPSFSGPIAAPLERTPESYASSYDLRTYNKLNSIRNQGSCGACWAFSAIGSVESSLLPGESRDLSEQHLNKYHGFDNAECGGGSLVMAAAYFARWSGPYNETDYPYPYSSNAIWPGAGAYVQKHVQRVVWLPNDKDTLKSFISSPDYGAVTLAFFWGDAYYNASNSAFYCPTAQDTNHVVLIVGWDDNFAKTKFSTQPTNNGAWLCRNSWGTSWGMSGYFWISYEDKTIAGLTVFASVKPAGNYKEIIQYDPLGYTGNWGYNATTAWGANIFTATTNSPLRAISYITNDACNVSYYVYKNPSATNPTSGTLVSSGTSSFGYAAYLTNELASPVTLAAGDRFSVVIKFVNNSYTWPVTAEGYNANYSSAVTNAAGQSFLSYNGSTWSDFYSFSNNANKANCCIKAFAGITTYYTLTMQKNGNGTTTPVTGTYSYPAGTDVTISASPDAHNVFTGWSRDASGKVNPVTINLDRDKSVTANFKLVSPPSNLTAVRLTNRSVTQTEYIVDLSWNANTANAGLNIVVYRVYQKVGDSWVNLADLPTNTLTYRVRMVPKGEQTFGVASVDEGGVESARITIVK
ncbi:MAG: lectin like domain-containing protein [Candidatus Aminicenantes bacterium]|nr:lectin like domain-containing protein [Candidatus Aminicenantes bacterium]